MKHSLLLALLFPSLFLSAQRQMDFYSLRQYVSAQAYTGSSIRFQAALRMEKLDSAAKAGIWVRVDKADGRTGFFHNNWEEIQVTDQWQTFTIEGHVEENADRIALGGVFGGKARFYFDDFRLSVLTNGNWEPVPLFNPSFEDTATSRWFFGHANKFLPLQFTTRQPAEGRQAFWYDGQNNRTHVAYGTNPEAGEYATVNGIRLYYETYGQGEPLLLLHGNSQNIKEYTQQIDYFKDKYRVIAVDTRGHGRSATDTTRYTYHLFAKDMKVLLDHLKLDSVNILGWSDGGNTGLIMAMQYPRKVKKLAIMGANVFINKDAVQSMVFTGIDRLLKELATDSSAKARTQTRLLHLLLEEPNMRFEDLTAIHCPVLVMAGENDLILDKHTRSIAQHIKRSQLVIFPQGSHYMPQENPAIFNKTVLEFLQKP